MTENERDQAEARRALLDDSRTDPDAQAGVLAEYVAAGVLSRELADKMLANVERCAEPCPTCHVGRGRQCIDSHGVNVAQHVDRTAAAK